MVFIRHLRWNDWNIAHIARHAVTPDEVDEVCHSRPMVAEGYGGRILLIGPMQSGRMLAVLLGPEDDGVYYPITARPASRKERRLYQERAAGETG